MKFFTYFLSAIFLSINLFLWPNDALTLEILEEICPPGNNYWPHWNCSQFYVCSEAGNHLVNICPTGLYFSPVHNVCDFPYFVPECEGGTRAPPDTTATYSTIGTPTSTISSITTTRTTTNTDTPPSMTPTTSIQTTATPPGDGGVCPDGSVFWPHEICRQYYICVSCGGPMLVSCHEGYFYNPDIESCDLESNVGECVGGTRPPTTTVPTPNECPPSGIHKIPHETLCTAFYLCVEGVRDDNYYLCPNDNYFDPVSEQCVDPSLVECSGATDARY